MNGTTLLLSLALAATAAQTDQVYKWTDASGIIHYTDQPPPQGTKFDKVSLDGGNGRADQDAAKASAVPTPAPATTTSAATEPAANAGTPAQQVAKACEQARARLEILQSKFPVTEDAKGDGKPQALDDATRQSEVAKAQAAVAAYCK